MGFRFPSKKIRDNALKSYSCHGQPTEVSSSILNVDRMNAKSWKGNVMTASRKDSRSPLLINHLEQWARKPKDVFNRVEGRWFSIGECVRENAPVDDKLQKMMTEDAYDFFIAFSKQYHGKSGRINAYLKQIGNEIESCLNEQPKLLAAFAEKYFGKTGSEDLQAMKVLILKAYVFGLANRILYLTEHSSDPMAKSWGVSKESRFSFGDPPFAKYAYSRLNQEKIEGLKSSMEEAEKTGNQNKLPQLAKESLALESELEKKHPKKYSESQEMIKQFAYTTKNVKEFYEHDYKYSPVSPLKPEPATAKKTISEEFDEFYHLIAAEQYYEQMFNSIYHQQPITSAELNKGFDEDVKMSWHFLESLLEQAKKGDRNGLDNYLKQRGDDINHALRAASFWRDIDKDEKRDLLAAYMVALVEMKTGSKSDLISDYYKKQYDIPAPSRHSLNK